MTTEEFRLFCREWIDEITESKHNGTHDTIGGIILAYNMLVGTYSEWLKSNDFLIGKKVGDFK